MRSKAIRVALLAAISAMPAVVHAQVPARPQPIPVEFTLGTRYASSNVVLSRTFGPGSRLGFFHLNTIIMDYDNAAEDDLSMQNLLFFEPVEHFRLTGGVFYGARPGLSPTVGAQYVNASRNWFVLLSPRVNVQEEPSYSVFTIARYSANRADGPGLYASIQALNSFDDDGHIRSYQWLRLGIDSGATQYGVALNLDESGPDPDVKPSIGLFVRREIF